MNTKLIEHSEQREESLFESFQPLNQMGHSPSRFPLQALPGWLRDYVKAVAEAVQAPVDFVATMSLAALSIAVQRHYRVRVKDGWELIPSDFFIGILPSGAGKSPVFRYLLNCLRQFERDYNERSQDKAKRQKLEKRLLDYQAHLEEETDYEELAVLEDSIGSTQRELDSVLAVPLRFTAQDVTPEQLLRMLREQGGILAWVSDEGSEAFASVLGAYDKGKSNKFDGVLKAWSQDVIEVDRISREGGQVHSPTLTMMLAVQPGVLRDLGSDVVDRLVIRGFLPRFLFSMPRPMLGERDPNPPTVPKALRNTYERNMKRLLSASFVEDAQPIELTLSEEAKRARIELVADVNAVIGEGGEMEHFSDFLAKLEAHFVRLMGMLFAATYFGERTEMDGEMASKARLVIDYFQEQAEAVFEALNLSPEKRAQLRAFGFVRRIVRDTGSREIKASQVYARARKSIDRTELYGLLVQLAKVGYLRELPKTHGNSSPLYEVNPKAL